MRYVSGAGMWTYTAARLRNVVNSISAWITGRESGKDWLESWLIRMDNQFVAQTVTVLEAGNHGLIYTLASLFGTCFWAYLPRNKLASHLPSLGNKYSRFASNHARVKRVEYELQRLSVTMLHKRWCELSLTTQTSHHQSFPTQPAHRVGKVATVRALSGDGTTTVLPRADWPTNIIKVFAISRIWCATIHTTPFSPLALMPSMSLPCLRRSRGRSSSISFVVGIFVSVRARRVHTKAEQFKTRRRYFAARYTIPPQESHG